MNFDANGHKENVPLSLSLMIIMMMMMARRMMVTANVDNEASGVVSDHVEKLSVKTQRVDLILTISPGQHRDDAIYLSHSGLHHLSLSLLSGFAPKTEFVCLEKRRDVKVLCSIDPREVRLVTERTLEAERCKRLVEVEDRI